MTEIKNCGPTYGLKGKAFHFTGKEIFPAILKKLK